MSECPFLKYKVSKSCVSCTGYVCQAYGREKKLSDTKQCKSDYVDCPRYIDTLPKDAENLVEPKLTELINIEPVADDIKVVIPILEPPPPKQLFVRNPCGCGEDIRLSLCPYQSTKLPDGTQSCTGLWCYGNNRSIRVPKNCWNWQICTVYFMSKYKGVPFP
jgi:hypothetical protein